MEEELKPEVENTEETQPQEISPITQEDSGLIKVDLGQLNKADAEVVEQEEKQPEPEDAPKEQLETTETPVLQEITEEEVVEQAEEIEKQVVEAIEKQEPGIELPENIQKVVDFMNDTGGSLKDYVNLNTDYSSLNEDQLLREYYENTKPHLDSEEIGFVMEDKFSFDEEMDEDRDIRRKKLARKEELAKAKNHLESLKGKYYEEIKAGSRLNPEQKKAVEFFNRYNQDSEKLTEDRDRQSSIFNEKTEKLFSNEFKGFDFEVGEKKFRYNVNDIEGVKSKQGDISNFVKKFLNDKNEMADAKGYHKSLFTAMNPDAIANHFYQQGKADAMKTSMEKAKNIDMNPRGTHEDVKPPNGWKVRSVPGNNGSTTKLRIKKRK
tara:strand:- start:12 stop:1148 length:1137 start_codon:yes stop_codon:yes gene_type:complete